MTNEFSFEPADMPQIAVILLIELTALIGASTNALLDHFNVSAEDHQKINQQISSDSKRIKDAMVQSLYAQYGKTPDL